MGRTKEFDEAVVLEKAVDLFRCKGYNGASMQDVVDALGLSRSSIYDTYGDKHELYVQALRKYKQQVTDTMVEMITSSTDIKSTINSVLNYVIRDLEQPKEGGGCFMVNAAIELSGPDADITSLVNENRTAIEGAMASALKRAQVNNCVSSRHSPEALAAFLFNVISGLRVAAKSGASIADLQNTVDIALTVL